MYCVKDKDKWYCIDDEVYARISDSVDGYMAEHPELYKKNGNEYGMNKEGNYEQKDS